MKIKITILSIIVLFFLISLKSLKVSSRNQQEQIEELQNVPDKGTIAWHARLAKAKGLRKVALPGPIVDYGMAENLDEALSFFSVVVAEPISHKTHIASTLALDTNNKVYEYKKDNEIHTWYKFRILENLSGKSLRDCSACQDDVDWEKLIPQDMLPVNRDEIMMRVNGGTVELDGVTVTEIYRLPKFLESNRYLLFLATETSGKVAGFGMGAAGIYRISTENTLIPFSKENNPVIHDITGLYNSSLDSLKTYIRNRPPKK